MGHDLSTRLADREVLITGGLGMIGSAIAHILVRAGAKVTLLDACIEPYGANMFNIEDIKDEVQVNIADIRDTAAVRVLVKGKHVVFNLAGQVSHNDSMSDPYLDASINYTGHLNVLESLRECNPEAVVLHAGSRLQYGRIERNPVDEDHSLHPRTPYALNKTAAENMYLFYHRIHGIPCVCFRIANPYGPRSQMRHSKYTIVNWFIRQAIEGREIPVFGDGSQVRDYVFVDDLAQAFVLAAVTPECVGRVFNVGSGRGTPFREMVQAVVDAVGSGTVKFVPWPDDYVNVETGDYTANITRVTTALPWVPQVGLEAGIEQTVRFYEQHRSHYW